MIRALCLVPIAVAGAVPVLVLPTPAIALLGGAALLLCGAGVLGRAQPLVTASGALAVIQYALALSLAEPGPDLVGAAVLGVALLLVLDMADFWRRFHGATVAASAWRRQAGHWILGSVLGALAALLLAAAPSVVRFEGPPALHPLLAAASALGVAAGLMGALGQRARDGAAGPDLTEAPGPVDNPQS